MDITQLTQKFGDGLINFFTEVPGVGDAMALLLAGGLVVAAFIIIVWYWFLHHRPFAMAIKKRTVFLESIGCARGEQVDDARKAFSEHYDAINKCMMEARHKQVFALRRAWEEYHDTIVNASSEILHNAVRPEHFFLNLGDRHRALSWFANIFIALGLLVTFLGIIAALSTLDFSGSVDAMQTRLNKLMQVTGAKFWASVGGILASIFLRIADFRFSKKISEGLSKLCDQLEHGMLFSPPQRIASDQLCELKEQSTALKTFSDKLQIAFENALEKQMTPGLVSIQQGIEQINSGSSKVVGEAIAKVAGAELTGLAESIVGMTNSMESMTERIAQQSSAADRQIEETVGRFGQASEEMRTAFSELNRNFEAVSERMRADSEEVSEQTRVRLGESLGFMREQMAASAAELGTVSTKAAENAVEIAQGAIEEVFQSFVVRFKQVGQPLVLSMEAASGAISTSANSIELSNQAIGSHARAMESMTERIAQQSSAADRKIEEIIGRFGQASEEIVGRFGQASKEMRTAFGELNRNFEAVSERMRADSEEASKQTSVRLLTSIEESLGFMQTQMAASAAEIGTVSADAAKKSAEIGQEAIEEVFRSFVVRFKQVGQPLVLSMEAASGAISTSANSIESSNQTIGSHARAMESMTERIAQQSSAADRKIEETVGRFGQVSEETVGRFGQASEEIVGRFGQASKEMRTAFGELNRNFEAVSERMRADSEEASEQTRVRLGENLGFMRTQMAESAVEIGTVSANAAKKAAEISQEAIEEVFQSFVERFKQVGQPLVSSMEAASGAISTSAYSIESSNQAIGSHARAIESVASGSRDFATSFATIANDVKSASEPVRQSVQSIEKALRSVETLMTEEARSNEASRSEMDKIAAALVETARAAETAWWEYRSRFADVDKALGEALNTLSTAVGSHAENVNERIGQIDRALGDGIAQLAGALAPLSELRDTVEDLSQIIEQHSANIKQQKEASE